MSKPPPIELYLRLAPNLHLFNHTSTYSIIPPLASKLCTTRKKVSTLAFVVYGISTMRPMSETIQDVKKTGLSEVIGARWLQEEYRRVGKLTSSLVIFLDPKAKVTFDEADS
ncbi:hypothetical protein EV426DRAFT_707967 [Tirmania nivea]|nr:hypothetical protein EV426DRAFT_707967 [Tirmania nivea]